MNEFTGRKKEDAARYSRKALGEYAHLSPNFVVYELASRDGADTFLVHPSLLYLLETIRAHFDRPVVVTSGFRSVAHNRRVGGASSSRHLWGLAADIRVIGVLPSDVQLYAHSLGIGGLGRYAGFSHVDVEGESRRF